MNKICFCHKVEAKIHLLENASKSVIILSQKEKDTRNLL